MRALALLRGVLLSALLVDCANTHKSARAEQLSREVPRERLAPVIDPDKLRDAPGVTVDRDKEGRGILLTRDGRRLSTSRRDQIENVLRKRIARCDVPPPDGISLGNLIKVARHLAGLNKRDLGCYAGLDALSRQLDLSAAEIRAVYAYLVEIGHALPLPRISQADRMIAGSTRPLTNARSTIRLIFPLTCDMTEALSADEAIDLLALGEARPVVAQLDLPGVENPPPARPGPQRIRAGKPAPPKAPVPQVDLETLAPELRCLVEPLEALRQLTGYLLPLVWVADEGARAGVMTEAGEPDHERMASAVLTLATAIEDERRGADAMGVPHPRLRGGALGLQQRLRARMAEAAAGNRAAWSRAREDAALRVATPQPRRAPLTAAERTIFVLQNRIAALRVEEQFGATPNKRAAAMSERATAQHDLMLAQVAARSVGPPE